MHEKRHFLSYRKHRHDAQITWPYAYYVTGESLQNGQWAPKAKLTLCPRDPQGYSCISLTGIRQDFERVPEHRVSFDAKPHAVFHRVCEIALTEVLATQMGVMRCSKKVSSFELYKLNPLSPDCGSIARELVHCYTYGRLRIVTVRGNAVGRHS